VHPAVTLRYPFLTLDEAAAFLGVSTEKARKLYDDGELPRALRLDGGLFEPTPGVTLIPYLEFVEQVGVGVGLELERWQRGDTQSPTRRSSAVQSLTLIPSDSAIDQVEKV
jgi:hypothetical protein